MGRIGPCVFLLKFSVAVCILLVKKLESMLFFCVRVNIVSGDNYSTVPLVTDNISTKSGSLRNSMQKCGEILRGRKDTLAPVVSTLWGRAPPSPPLFRRLCCSAMVVYHVVGIFDVAAGLWLDDKHTGTK